MTSLHIQLQISNNWQVQANSQAGASPQLCTKAIHLQPIRRTTLLLESSPFTRSSMDPDQKGHFRSSYSLDSQCKLAPSVRAPISPLLAAPLPHALEGLVCHLNLSTSPRRSLCSPFRGRDPSPRSVAATAPWLLQRRRRKTIAGRPEGDSLPAARLGISPRTHTRLIPGWDDSPYPREPTLPGHGHRPLTCN